MYILRNPSVCLWNELHTVWVVFSDLFGFNVFEFTASHTLRVCQQANTRTYTHSHFMARSHWILSDCCGLFQALIWLDSLSFARPLSLSLSLSGFCCFRTHTWHFFFFTNFVVHSIFISHACRLYTLLVFQRMNNEMEGQMLCRDEYIYIAAAAAAAMDLVAEMKTTATTSTTGKKNGKLMHNFIDAELHLWVCLLWHWRQWFCVSVCI